MVLQPKAEDLVDGYWEKILAEAGMGSEYFVYREGPCPVCGGTARFRWRAKTEDGFCNGCRHLDGWKLLRHFLQTDDFLTIANFIREKRGYGNGLVREGNPPRPAPAPKPRIDPEEEARKLENLRNWYRTLWSEARVVVEGDPVFNHLKKRFPRLTEVPKVIRYHPKLAYYEQLDGNQKRFVGNFPGLLAIAQGVDGRAVNIWRQWIDPVTFEKADVPGAAKMAAGKFLQTGYSVRLYEPLPNEDEIALTEGIENGIAVRLLYGLPVLSGLMASGLGGFKIPQGYEHIRKWRIYMDNDAPDMHGRRAGNDNAQKCKEYLRSLGYIATIIRPKFTNFDFANVASRL